MIKIKKSIHNQLIKDVLKKVGLPEEQASITSDIMSYADERGIDSHGIILLKTYVDRINSNIINKIPHFNWDKRSEVISVLDSDHGIGHFSGNLAMDKAIEIAKEESIGLVLVKNATHYGASGYYTEMASKEGMIGFTTTNTIPLMAPSGGLERVLGNNPFSFSIPRENKNPIILDIASSVVAAGKLILADQKGEIIPKGWALDKDGNPTTDPYEGYKGGGTLLPIGNHKGYGLALMMDIFAGVLTGSGYGKDVDNSNLGFVMLAIDVEKVMSKELFQIRLEELISMVRNSTLVSSEKNIFLPGEIEYTTKKEREKEGILINKKLFNQLKQIITDLDLSIENYFQY